MATNNLKRKLSKIYKIFDIDEVKNLEISKEYIQKYYKTNRIPYSLFHTNDDFMYMGISRGEFYDKDDLKEHARLIDKYIKKYRSKSVLELASGRSATTTYLAERNLGSQFYGVELSEGQLQHANKKLRKHTNLNVFQGDYHDLSSFKDEEFDLVYVIEAFCYSNNKQQVFNEVRRVLKKDGLFIVFDGYRGARKADADEEVACMITQKGMALELFEKYEDFLIYANKENFDLLYEENLSKLVIPTMKRFERLATIFLNLPLINKLILMTFPKEFIYNVIPAYLMPTLMEEGFGQYMFSVFQKK